MMFKYIPETVSEKKTMFTFIVKNNEFSFQLDFPGIIKRPEYFITNAI